MVREILLLGEAGLYERCEYIKQEEVPSLIETIGDLKDTLDSFNAANGFGKAISAPQIGLKKRLVYMYIAGQPVIFINPKLEFLGYEKQYKRERSLSFPLLEIGTTRHMRCRVKYRDMLWNQVDMMLEGEHALNIQQMLDHLDGILPIFRASDKRAMVYRSSMT